MQLKIIWLAAFLGVLTVCSCSGKSTTPITPEDNGIGTSLPVLEFVGDDPAHSLMGMWNANFDLETLGVEISPERRSDGHINVTSFIAPLIEINSYDPATGIIDVDVTITNPYTVDAYDVRLIIFTDATGHRLLNDDDWTSLYDIPGGLPINPFRTYAKSVPLRLFEGGFVDTENLRILLPGGNPNVTFAIDVSYPDNCLEPHKIGNLSQGAIYDEGGSSAMLHVGVYDHQNNADSVGLYLPDITGTSALLPFTYIGYSGWELELFNNTAAAMGQYDGFLVASSSDSGSLALYDDVKITISTLNGGWARSWGSKSSDIGKDVATDASGNIYVTGYFDYAVDFDPGPGEDWHTPHGDVDAYLSKFDKHGNFIWARTWGGEVTTKGYAADIDDSGNIYVTGPYGDIVDFDPGPGEDWHTSNGGRDIYLSKFDPNGNFVWALTWGGAGWGTDVGYDVTIDGSGNILVAGVFSGLVDFDPGPGETWHTTNDLRAMYLSKFDTNGDFQWARTWGTVEGSLESNFHDALAVAADSSGNYYVTGNFEDTVDFDPDEAVGTERTSNGMYDVYLSKFDSSGRFQWVLTWGGLDRDMSNGVVTNGSGNIYVTGSFDKTVDFDPSPDGVDEHISIAGPATFLSSFNTNGDFNWAQTWGGYGTDYVGPHKGQGIDSDNSGNIYVTNFFRGVVDFDPGPGVDERISNDVAWPDDAFLSKFNSNGDYIWARTWGGINRDKGYGVITDDTGNIFVTGYFKTIVDFDPGPGRDEHTTYFDGGYHFNPYLIKFLPNGYWE